MKTAASASQKNAEERHEKRSCLAVPYDGHVSDGGRRHTVVVRHTHWVDDGDGPSFVELRIHLV